MSNAVFYYDKKDAYYHKEELSFLNLKDDEIVVKSFKRSALSLFNFNLQRILVDNLKPIDPNVENLVYAQARKIEVAQGRVDEILREITLYTKTDEKIKYGDLKNEK